MVKLLSGIGVITGIFLFCSCQKRQDYGAAAVEKVANGWWMTAYSSTTGLIVIPPPVPSDTTSNHFFLVTYNSSGNSKDSVWVDDLFGIGGIYDVKALLGVNLSSYTFTSGGTPNLYQTGNDVQWAAGKMFPKGGRSRTGVATDSLFLQFLFTGNPGDTLTVAGVARTGFDGDDWPVSPYTPTP